MTTTDHSPAIAAAGTAIRLARYLSCQYSDDELARIVVDSYHRQIKEDRAAKAHGRPTGSSGVPVARSKPRRRRKAVAR
jgi:hypothetical protein